MRILVLLILSMLLAGCVTETVTIKELDKEGNVVKITTTKSSDVVDKIMNEMRNKDVIWYANGWRATIVATFTDSETYMPNVKLKAEKIDSGHLSLRPAMPAEDVIKLYNIVKTEMTVPEFLALMKTLNPNYKLADAADIIKAMKSKLAVEADAKGVGVSEK